MWRTVVTIAAALAVASCGSRRGGDDASLDPGGDDAAGDEASEDVGEEEEGWSYTEEREPCAAHDPLRRVFFGDLHAHTGLSFDAWSYDNRHLPGDAYRFAMGEAIDLPPLDSEGNGTRTVQLARPLDFAMVADHAEFFGEMLLCTEPGHAAYDTETCTGLRNDPESAVVTFGVVTASDDPVRFDICGPEAGCIEEAALERWLLVQQDAEEHYDRTSACGFVTFVGYEYTSTTDVSNNHRTVIFRNAIVPELPVTYYEAGTEWDLWAEMASGCLDAGTGCDAMTSAHNSNLSNGRMYELEYGGAATLDDEREMASLRLRLERVAEVFQHKGSSECRNGFDGIDPDPLCDFEQQWPEGAEDCGEGTGAGGMRLWGCVSRYDFLRNALKRGLEEERRLGVNPFRVGFTAATDTHNATPGKVEEDSYPGHVGTVDDSPSTRLGAGTVTHDTVIDNPGGLTAVWAEEKSRDAIFAALRRQEVYGTSGPRMALRFFGGWDLATTLCGADDLVRQGYDRGVPMGSDLPPYPGSGSPTFVVRAEADLVPLMHVQIVKVWLDASGDAWEMVQEVAGDPAGTATVDPDTCTPEGEGFDVLCGTWTDSGFDPEEPALYYVRVLENPTCRWTRHDCLTFDPLDRPEACSDPGAALIVNERAWSSPIWYGPD